MSSVSSIVECHAVVTFYPFGACNCLIDAYVNCEISIKKEMLVCHFPPYLFRLRVCSMCEAVGSFNILASVTNGSLVE